ncbi:serine/threonine-protein phosphatase 6 regulatory ankyrin repeat subunit B [Microdochium nivale]|nr:serine/threonine-protein phosphatase 6 regulatory ankyrin repeat subunit B [Microdochium nivale]
MPGTKINTTKTPSCLPSELLCYITHFLSTADALSLAAIDRRHHATLTGYIYRSLVRQGCSATSALIWAAARGSVATARRCLEAGADPDQQCDWMGDVISRGGGDGHRNHHGATSPLMCAVKNSHPDVARLLLQFGADPCAAVDFATPVTIAIDRGKAEIVRLMLLTPSPGNPSPAPRVAHTRCPRGSTPLHHAARRGRDDMIRLLLEHGGGGRPDNKPTLVELRDAQGETALMCAVGGARHETARILLDAGGDMWALDRRGRDCIEHARDVAMLAGPAGKATLDVLFARLQRSRVVVTAAGGGGESVRERERYLALPSNRVYAFLTCGVLGVVEAVLDAGGAADGSPALTAQNGVTPLWHYAGTATRVAVSPAPDTSGPARRISSEERDILQQRRRAIIGMLIDHGADVDFRDGERGMTPLMRAAEAGFADVVHLLLERGASVDARDKEGLTALEHASDDECKLRLLQALRERPGLETSGTARL